MNFRKPATQEKSIGDYIKNAGADHRNKYIQNFLDKKILFALVVIILGFVTFFGYSHYHKNRQKNDVVVRYINDSRDYIYEITNTSKRIINNVVVTFLVDVDSEYGEDFTIDKNLYVINPGETKRCKLSAIEIKDNAEKTGITIKYIFGVEVQKIIYN